MRVNRFLSQAGLGSRRSVESLVLEGRVRVNGDLLQTLAFEVDPELDRVEVDGQVVVVREPNTLLLFHKPVGVVCSMQRQDSRPCLKDALDPALFDGQRLFNVGRLDADSSGLLLLSDDGELAQRLQRPAGRITKIYEVHVDSSLNDLQLETLRDGSLVLDDRPCRKADVEAVDRHRRQLRIGLREGRNRQIRRMMELLGVRVLKLHRTSIGSLELGSLGAGRCRHASPEEISRIRHEIDRAAAASSSDDPSSRE